MKSFFRNNGLSIVLATVFFIFLLGQFVVGRLEYNDDQRDHGEPPVSLREYITTGHFFEATFENMESEFLQMTAYVLLTVFLVQRGSAESRDPDEKEEEDQALGDDVPGPVRKGGWPLKIYAHSLSLAFFALFMVAFVGHAIAGANHYNEERLAHGEPRISIFSYLGTARFWFESLQNWQSEFLAVLAIVVLSIWLRERGSPESKKVTAPHRQTGG